MSLSEEGQGTACRGYGRSVGEPGEGLIGISNRFFRCRGTAQTLTLVDLATAWRLTSGMIGQSVFSFAYNKHSIRVYTWTSLPSQLSFFAPLEEFGCAALLLNRLGVVGLTSNRPQG